jgi:hypothetical protein
MCPILLLIMRFFWWMVPVALNLAMTGCNSDALPAQPTIKPAVDRNRVDDRLVERWAATVNAIPKEEQERILCENFTKSLKECLRKAEIGDPIAQQQVAYLYASSSACYYDLRLSANWMERSARGGSVNALREIGLKYLNGDGVLPDPVKAYAYLKVFVSLAPNREFARVIREVTIEQVVLPLLDSESVGRAEEMAREIYGSLPRQLPKGSTEPRVRC